MFEHLVGKKVEKLNEARRQEVADAELQEQNDREMQAQAETEEQARLEDRRKVFEATKRAGIEAATFLTEAGIEPNTIIHYKNPYFEKRPKKHIGWFSTTALGIFLENLLEGDSDEYSSTKVWILEKKAWIEPEGSGDRQCNVHKSSSLALDPEGNLYDGENGSYRLRHVSEKSEQSPSLKFDPNIPIDEQEVYLYWQNKLSVYVSQIIIERTES